MKPVRCRLGLHKMREDAHWEAKGHLKALVVFLMCCERCDYQRTKVITVSADG